MFIGFQACTIDKLIHYLYHFDYPGGSQHEPSRTPSSTALVVNVEMYIVGDRYQLEDLKELAKHKFSLALASSWNQQTFPEVIRTIYENTLPTDRGLRDLLVPVLKSRTLTELIHTYLDFAVDAIDAVAKLD
ncbi:MAG: hypothetical protein Q9210_004405 [Variospora velana]